MKMKEVCEKTGLTDRAVRLYIENGLVSPKYNENYAGRRNIDFSSEDVGVLKEVATLRKAGFSIAEIKELKSNPENAKEVLKTVIGNTEKRITTDTEVVTCLTPLLKKESVEISDICKSLNNPVIEESKVPSEDMEAPLFMRIFRRIFKIVSVLALLLNTLNIINIFREGLPGRESVLYPDYKDLICVCLLFAFSVMSAVYFLISGKKKKHLSKGFIIKKAVLSAVLIAVLLLITYVTSIWSILYSWGVEIKSETAKTENYMMFDDAEAKKALSEFLPERLSEIEGTEYKYSYTDYTYSGAPYHNETEIYLHLPLSFEEFEKTVEYYKSFRPKDASGEPRVFEKGLYWNIICYREDDEEAPSDYEAMFAYSEEREEVRLICRYGNVAAKGAITAEYWIDDYKW